MHQQFVTPLTSVEGLVQLQAEMRAHMRAAQYPSSLKTRLQLLRHLRDMLHKYEPLLLEALAKDLGKCQFESYSTELMVVYEEIDYFLKHLHRLMRPRQHIAGRALFPARAKVFAQPKGLVLIIAPWNYPVNLSLVPLVDALAAGNSCVIKLPSAARHTSDILSKFMSETFDQAMLRCVADASAFEDLKGAVSKAANTDTDFQVSVSSSASCFSKSFPRASDLLYEVSWDHIMFTGSSSSGRAVMAAAAKHLSPVTLELGGKSPCVVNVDANISVAARRIAWGKSLNSGQTCVAPDYIIAHESIVDELCQELQHAFISMYGTEIVKSPEWPHLISSGKFRRALKLLKSSQEQGAYISWGGIYNEQSHQIAPTLVRNVSLQHPLMSEELFCPILPVLEFGKLCEVTEIINHNPQPLALYYFGKHESDLRFLMSRVAFGGGCMNDVVAHVANNHVPFGGFGRSGQGSYHGKAGFDCFSHYCSVQKNPTWLNLSLRQAPFGSRYQRLRKYLP